MRPNILFSGLAATSLVAASPHGPLDPTKKKIWQPKVGTKYQMILTGVVDPTAPIIRPFSAPVYDIDLFYHPKSTIDTLHAQGKKVVCYFSAGSSEDWRPDYADFPEEAKGPCYDGWAGERWLDTRSDGVFDVMKKRIALASQKGCDGIDPDNVDGWESGGTYFNLTKQDSVNYFKKMAAEAHSYGMAVGLKNAQDMLSEVASDAQFAVNESCGESSGAVDCNPYTEFTEAGKPIFHVEYVSNYTIKHGRPVISSSDPLDQGQTSEQLKAKFCLRENDIGRTISTTIKFLNLDGWVLYCDDTWTNTSTTYDGVKKGLRECPNGN
jgi:hypothetical protein